MSNIVSMPVRPVTFDVEVTHDIAQDADERTTWVAVCDALGLVTEHETYEGLLARIWEVMPDLLDVNELRITVADVRLQFRHVEGAPQLLAL